MILGLKRTISLLSSFKIALFVLVSVMILIVIGTLFQNQLGIFDVQEKFFRSFFVFLDYSSIKIPIFPGGYLLGGLLIINLISSLLSNLHRFWSKLGIYLIHVGLVLLLIGETLGGIFSSETILPLNVGMKKNYSIDIISSDSAASIDDERGFRYFPFWIELSDFKHESYPGIDIPKSFLSMVRIYSNDDKLVRTAFISMNNPLKYKGYTFYQSGFGNDGQQSILKVVKNPTSLSPYLFSCLVILGFIYQFIHGFSFNRNRVV